MTWFRIFCWQFTPSDIPDINAADSALVYAIARYRMIDRVRALKRHSDRHAELDLNRVDEAIATMIENAETRMDLEKGYPGWGQDRPGHDLHRA